ncbi:hypothetical protein H5410_017079 [Solanum commersonii]|uniref:Uncharacterized protein n=1 Tax=Solanum commersonii TaxID=4109 RepID=A0A9J5ZZH4_SOLCO|nr:hypothetical protein H5410_017079 [Solanum commersonii]
MDVLSVDLKLQLLIYILDNDLLDNMCSSMSSLFGSISALGAGLCQSDSCLVPPLPSKGRQGNIMALHHRESQSPELCSKVEKGDMGRFYLSSLENQETVNNFGVI